MNRQPLTCTEVLANLPLYAGRDLEELQLAELDAHLARCEDCRASAQRVRAARDSVAALARAGEAPDLWPGVRTRLAADLAPARGAAAAAAAATAGSTRPGPQRGRGTRGTRWGRWGAAASAAGLIGLALLRGLDSPAVTPDPAPGPTPRIAVAPTETTLVSDAAPAGAPDLAGGGLRLVPLGEKRLSEETVESVGPVFAWPEPAGLDLYSQPTNAYQVTGNIR